MSQSYSTINVPDDRSVAAWQEAMAEVYYRLDIKALQKDRLNGELVDMQCGSIGISSFKADAQRVIRRRQSARLDGSEDLVFLFPIQQEMQFQQRGRSGSVKPGGVFLVNSAEDYVIDVPDGSENVTLKINRDVIKERVKDIDARCARLNIANPHLISVVSQLGLQLLKVQTRSDSLQVQDVVIELICLMLELNEGSRNLELVQKPLTDILFERVYSYLKRHARDPDLSPDDVARAHHISVRYLHRSFQLKGRTFGRELLEMRLQEAHRLLLAAISTRSGRINIGNIAFACGFNSQAHFSTRYRGRFGVSPRDQVVGVASRTR